MYFFVCFHTKPKLLSRVGGEGESKDCHGGDEEAGHNQVGKVVQGSPPNAFCFCYCYCFFLLLFLAVQTRD